VDKNRKGRGHLCGNEVRRRPTPKGGTMLLSVLESLIFVFFSDTTEEDSGSYIGPLAEPLG